MSILSNEVGAEGTKGRRSVPIFNTGYTAITKRCDHRCRRHKGGSSTFQHAVAWKSLLCVPLALPRYLHLLGLPLDPAFLDSCLQTCLAHLTVWCLPQSPAWSKCSVTVSGRKRGKRKAPAPQITAQEPPSALSWAHAGNPELLGPTVAFSSPLSLS